MMARSLDGFAIAFEGDDAGSDFEVVKDEGTALGASRLGREVAKVRSGDIDGR